MAGGPESEGRVREVLRVERAQPPLQAGLRDEVKELRRDTSSVREGLGQVREVLGVEALSLS